MAIILHCNSAAIITEAKDLDSSSITNSLTKVQDIGQDFVAHAQYEKMRKLT